MKQGFHFLTVYLIATIFLFQTTNAQNVEPQPAVYQQKMQSAALLFMENKGQVADNRGNLRSDILFTASSGSTKIYLTGNSIHYQFSKTVYPEGYEPFSKGPVRDAQKEAELRKQIKTSTHRFTVQLQNANPNPAITREQESDFTENYYLAQCPNGITGVHGYEKLTFRNVYPNIDWVVYSKGGFMEYDFLVHPGGNQAQIKLQVRDADQVGITSQGELLIKTSLGEVKEKAPASYIDERLVPSHFRQNSDGSIGFEVQPQPGKELRIDPSIVWTTYYGGSGDDYLSACSIDGNNNVYVSGNTTSPNNIASGGFQDTLFIFGDHPDYFIVKFNEQGNRIWATYYGGEGYDDDCKSRIDKAGNVYLVATTGSQGLAYNGFQDSIRGMFYDALLVKFNTNGLRIWATYYGGTNSDYGSDCSVDKYGNVYLAGATASPNNIAYNGFQITSYTNSNGLATDAFLVKFDSNGNRIWATYYGGAGQDWGDLCTTDTSDNIYLIGHTTSTTNIALGGFQNTFGGGTEADAFIVKFDTGGSRLWATYYGGTKEDGFIACTNDNNNLYLLGSTSSTSNIATAGQTQSFYGGGQEDAFLVKFNSNGNRLWATYYGGNNYDFGYGCTVNSAGYVYICGKTESPNNIASGGFQNTLNIGSDGLDRFLAKFNSNGTRIWGTYFGRNSSGLSCAVNSSDKVYLCDRTKYTTGLYGGGFQNNYGGGYYDGIIVKIDGSKSFSTLCPNGSTYITSPVTGSTYQWQVSQDSGVTWVNLTSPSAILDTLQLSNVLSSSYGYQYRCFVNGNIYTDIYQLKFQNTWMGSATNTAWENPSNWSCGIVPDGNTDVVINNGPVILNSNGICRTLTVRPGVFIYHNYW